MQSQLSPSLLSSSLILLLLLSSPSFLLSSPSVNIPLCSAQLRGELEFTKELMERTKVSADKSVEGEMNFSHIPFQTDLISDAEEKLKEREVQ